MPTAKLGQLLYWVIICVSLSLAGTASVRADYAPNALLEGDLSQSTVTSIVEDRYGFLWIGTADGLNRFDGYAVKIFNKQNSQLPNTSIRDLEIDQNGDLWIATQNGVALFEQNTGKIINFYHNAQEPFSIADNFVTSLAMDETGGMWVGTYSGPSYYDPKIKGFKTLPIMKSRRVPAPLIEVSDMMVDSQQRVWLVTTAGHLARYNRSLEHFDIIENNFVAGMGTVDSVVETPDGKLWLLSSNLGLIEFDPVEQTYQPKNLTDLGLTHNDMTLNRLYFDRKQRLWVGTESNGLYTIKEGKVVDHHIYGKPGSVGSNNINVLYQDSSDILWIGSSTYLNKINPNAINFTHIDHRESEQGRLKGEVTYSILATDYDHLLVGSDTGGLTVLPRQGSESQPLDFELPQQLKGKNINRLLPIGAGRHWLIAERSIWIFDELQLEFELVFQAADAQDYFITGHYDGRFLWLGTKRGLWRLNKDNSLKKFRLVDIDFHRDNRINVLLPDKNNDDYLWIGSDSGVYRFSKSNEIYISLNNLFADLPTQAEDIVFSLAMDDASRLWIGTFGGGLIVVDLISQKYTVLNNAVSNIHETIYSLVKDEGGSIWAGTGGGLFRIDPNDFSLSHFSVTEDQPIIEFNTGATAKDRQGNLYFGGMNGVVYFNPQAYSRDDKAPTPVITDILVNNNSIVVGEQYRKRLSKPANIADQVVIYPEDTAVSFDFSGFNFTDPWNNRFRYKLEGYDDNWTETDAKSRRVTYTNLKPGQYRFMVNAANKDGLWSEQPAEIDVEVKNLAWLSPFAYTIYGFMLGLIILAFSYLIWARMRERQFAAQQLAESEERLKLSLWGSGDELWDWQVNTGALHLSNEWPYDFPRDGIRSGYSMANSNIHPNDLPYVKQALNAHLAGKSLHFESTYRISNEQGGWIWVLDRGKVVSRDSENKPLRMAGTLKNISDLKDTEQQLSMVVKSFDNISDAVWILDEDYVYIAVNKAYTKITGYEAEEVIGLPIKDTSIVDAPEQFVEDLREVLEQEGSWSGELEAFRKNGQVYPIEINIDVVRDSDGNIINYVGVFSDITFRKKAEKELRRLATVDQLTGLRNRSSFKQRFEEILALSSETDQHALLFIDLDNFKRINDSLGHGVGDELLTLVARALLEITSDNNGVVARLGGDEFTVVLTDVDTWSQPAKYAQAILEFFSKPLKLTNAEVVVSPSIGIVMYPENGESAEELLKNADMAMYYAKKKGKNTYQFYTRQMNEQAQLRINLESELRQAIEKDEFVVFYQPKVSLETGKITSMEALVRWRNPNRGLVMPGEFIPLAEEAGFIIPISQKVIEKTCLQLKDWKNRGIYDGKIAVNLSAVQFYSENLWETVKNALHIAKMDASALEFEITEGMVMQDLAHSIQQMRNLKEMGISLALDDFGVGYSSLGNLKDFPIDTLKIDRSFVWDLEDSERDQKLVASIVTLAHNLGIKVVAEGVETVLQVDVLRKMGCEEIQGYIFSKPVPPWEMEAMLSDENTNLETVLYEMEEEE
ncbi:EAL domain-containing protein [Kangiella sediminilitoris]|uniref:cyclic-guanylate-specific phosphodiesterase n=1 Tax=Kangiella sediminilitoris TaxID=1144748 RepID=A0A1B3B7W2_9GAMM|nr:EAL domain-containing protein [Kangiella sediminilitoris]AOE48867.1 Diguanylate cyclase/phosphodiesterase with PAS/PAC sensor(S) [Kangiella sediminilitoris]